MDCNQTQVIGATWQPAFIDGVKGHKPRAKVKYGQVVRYVKIAKLVITSIYFDGL